MPPIHDSEFHSKAANIKAILSDVDGVLTDGGIAYDNNGVESKRFHVRDGLGIKLWRMNDFRFGILTARQSRIVEIRGQELKIDTVCQGFESKWPQAEIIFEQWKLNPSEICYVGDDLTDLPVLKNVGLAASVADACQEVKEVADLVTTKNGGQGAVREIIETILKSKQLWQKTLSDYESKTAGNSTQGSAV